MPEHRPPLEVQKTFIPKAQCRCAEGIEGQGSRVGFRVLQLSFFGFSSLLQYTAHHELPQSRAGAHRRSIPLSRPCPGDQSSIAAIQRSFCTATVESAQNNDFPHIARFERAVIDEHLREPEDVERMCADSRRTPG